jgi:hypothetical protein
VAYQQDILQRIIDISGAGALLFVRCHFFAGGESVSSIVPTAYVQDLPDGWEGFDFFDDGANQKDPKVKGDKLNDSIRNPVTDDMLTLYRYFHLYDTQTSSKTIPPGTPNNNDSHYIVWADGYPYPDDPANPGRSGLMGDFGSDRAAAYKYADLLNADTPGRIIGYVKATGPPPDFPIVYLPIYSGGSPPSHVIEITAPAPRPVQQRVVDAVVIFNLSKMQASLQTDPKTGKKPADFTFKITVPTNFPKTVGSDFEIKAATYKTSKPSKPPKDTDGRRDYPVTDKEVDGIMQFLVPTWTPYPNKTDKPEAGLVAGRTGGATGVYVEVKVTFGKKLNVLLTPVGSGSNGEIG